MYTMWKNLHIKENHTLNKKCRKCDDVFEENWLLENHMKTHDDAERFKCNVCDKTFLLQWRLNKHMNGHQTESVKCHYFNNEKSCPYEEVGCMFDHNISEKCKFFKICRRPMCQYRHEITNEDIDESIINDVENNDDEEDESDEEHFPCDSCEQVYNDVEDLIEHYGETAHNL